MLSIVEIFSFGFARPNACNIRKNFCFSDYIRSIIAYIAVHLAVICSNTTMFVVQYLKREETLLNCLIYTFSFGVALVILLIFTLVYIAKNHPYKTKIFEDDNLMMDDLNLDESSQRNLQNESFTYQSFQSQPLNIPGASRLTRVRRPLTVNTDASSSYDCFENDEVFHLSMTTGASGDSMLVNASDAVSSSKQADVHQVLCLGYNRSAAVDRDFWISGARSSPCQESPVTNEDSLSDEVFKSVDSEDDSSEMPSLHKESSSVEMMQCGAEEDFLPIEEQPQ